jgi:hypothetical protein
MFVRKVMTLLKPNSILEFSLLMEQEVIPVLREERGFRDGMSFFAPREDAVTTISLWDKASNADAYSRGTFAEEFRKLSRLIKGIPKVVTYELVNSTWLWFQGDFYVCAQSNDLIGAEQHFRVQPLNGTKSNPYAAQGKRISGQNGILRAWRGRGNDDYFVEQGIECPSL